MTNPNKRRGDRAELEAAKILTDLGWPTRRKLGAGRADDTGDIDGIDGVTIQVAAWKNVTQAVRVKPIEVEQQRRNAGDDLAVTLVRLHGGDWRAVMTLPQLAAWLKETGR